MIKNIKIQNYQSIKELDLEIRPFTVVVGPSDSGKSAFFRAITTLISNRRGSDFIRHGEKLTKIEAELEQGSITLQRGKATNDNFYEIAPTAGNAEKFTKLSGTVPEEVTDFLGIQPKDPINIAGQHDKPYLLDTKEYGPSETARILGALTNVNVIFEGARESNRQKTQANATLRTRETDNENSAQKLLEYTGLEEQQAALELIQQDIEAAEMYTSSLAALRAEISTYEINETKIEVLSPILQQEAVDFTAVDKTYDTLTELSAIISTHNRNEAKRELSLTQVTEYEQQALELEHQYQEELRKAGTCPTCGQLTHTSTD